VRDQLDPIIHAEARLRILTTLAELPPPDAILFTRLAKLLGMTAGNLTTHLGKLEDAGYVTIDKGYEGNRPATYLKMTEPGRQAYQAYLTQLRRLLPGV